MRARARIRDERGGGAILVVAILGALTAWTVLALAAMTVFPTSQRAANAADSAALAAADVASGAIAGIPCDTAAEAAGMNGGSLDACELDGPIATVQASVAWSVFKITAVARAGPHRWDGGPPSSADQSRQSNRVSR